MVTGGVPRLDELDIMMISMTNCDDGNVCGETNTYFKYRMK